MATPLIVNALLQTDMLTGKRVQNAALFPQGAEQIEGGLADVMSSLGVESLKFEKELY